jgi:acyl-CoA thioester hydrolase
LKQIDVIITARYQETDKMGVIHHSVYPIWFEVARTELIRSCGYPYSELEKNGLMLPLFRLEADYKHPAYYEDQLNVGCGICELSRTRLTLSYEIYRLSDQREEKNLISRGYTHHAFTDNRLKPVNIQKEFPEVYEALYSFYHEKGKL